MYLYNNFAWQVAHNLPELHPQAELAAALATMFWFGCNWEKLMLTYVQYISSYGGWYPESTRKTSLNFSNYSV